MANAVYDGSSAVMLSGESAAGKYPVEAVRSMAQICEYTEQNISYKKRFRTNEFRIENTLDAISHATCTMSIDVGAKAIVVCSVSGITARMVSRFRSPVDIVGMTTDPKAWRKLALSWGVVFVVTNALRLRFFKPFHVTINVDDNKSKSDKEEQMMTTVIKVEGMMCPHCKARVESVCKAVPGATDAVVDLAAKTVTVSGSADKAALEKAIVDAGYEVIG